MKAAPFVYHRPRTLDHALALLDTYAPLDGRILAGGQSLTPMMAYRVARPGHLIDINRIAALQQIHIGGNELIIGACVRHSAFCAGVAPGPTGRLLSAVSRRIAHAPIRARGTFCGSLANADPASEWCLVLATLDGRVETRSVKGAREIAARDFFQGVMTTAIEPEEMLVGARLPLLPGDAVFGFAEVSRRAGDFALAAALVAFRIVDGVILDARLGVGGAEAFPRRFESAEAMLAGQAPGARLFDRVADLVASSADILPDANIDSTYRRDLVRAMARQALEQAAHG